MGASVELDREQEEELRRQGELMEEIPVTVDESGTLELSFSLDFRSVAELE